MKLLNDWIHWKLVKIETPWDEPWTITIYSQEISFSIYEKLYLYLFDLIADKHTRYYIVRFIKLIIFVVRFSCQILWIWLCFFMQMKSRDITISNRYLCMMIEIKFDIDPDSSWNPAQTCISFNWWKEKMLHFWSI